MVRGGQREGAGRKSDWESKAKFEDTTVIRVPKNIKDKVMVVARKLDAGEGIDLDSNVISSYLFRAALWIFSVISSFFVFV